MYFCMRRENLELRSCSEQLTATTNPTTAEIVQWGSNSDYCWTIAYWVRSPDGFYLQFVAGRPFTVDSDSFMKLAKLGQEILESIGEV